MSIADDHHNHRRDIQDDINRKVSAELSYVINGCPKTSLHSKHVPFLTRIVFNLLEQKDSCNTYKYEIFEGSIGHIYSFNTGTICSNRVYERGEHYSKQKEGNYDQCYHYELLREHQFKSQTQKSIVLGFEALSDCWFYFLLQQSLKQIVSLLDFTTAIINFLIMIFCVTLKLLIIKINGVIMNIHKCIFKVIRMNFRVEMRVVLYKVY